MATVTLEIPAIAEKYPQRYGPNGSNPQFDKAADHEALLLDAQDEVVQLLDELEDARVVLAERCFEAVEDGIETGFIADVIEMSRQSIAKNVRERIFGLTPTGMAVPANRKLSERFAEAREKYLDNTDWWETRWVRGRRS